MKKLLSGIVILAMMASCASVPPPVNDLDYNKNNFVQIKNQKVIDDTFDNVWDNLVSGLSKTFYVINNIDKQSRLINISFNMNDKLSEYIDCGVSNRNFELADLSDSVSYKVADSSSYFTTSTAPPNPNVTYHKAFRNTSLVGRANVYIAPSEDGTTVMVNTRYVFDVKVSFDTYLYAVLYKTHNKVTSAGRRNSPTDSPPVSFNTNTEGNNGGITCSATGRFEEDILQLI